MQFTLEDIKRALNAITPSISPAGIISEGSLNGASGPVNYSIHLGWDLLLANLCDNTWSAFNNTIMRHIRKLEEAGADIGPILDAVQLDDSHWRWLEKSLYYRGESFKWFFLVAEGYPQAACLVYQPKPSVVNAGQIFYVEYLAAAPWNRENPVAARVFKGTGPLLLNCVSEYATSKLGLTLGFSLHSIPKAVSFYKKIGMTAFPAHDKGELRFFEWVSDIEKGD